MTDAGYVVAGWSLCALVLGGYSYRLVRRVRAAERDEDAGSR